MTVVFVKKHVFWISPSKTLTSFQQIQTILHDFSRICEYFNFMSDFKTLLPLFLLSFHSFNNEKLGKFSFSLLQKEFSFKLDDFTQ